MGLGFRGGANLGVWFRIWVTCKLLGLWFRVQGVGCKVYGVGCRVDRCGFRFWGLEFGV